MLRLGVELNSILVVVVVTVDIVSEREVEGWPITIGVVGNEEERRISACGRMKANRPGPLRELSERRKLVEGGEAPVAGSLGWLIISMG